MANSLDVAAYIVARLGGQSDGLSVQKLTYFSQAWFLAWEGRPLFAEVFEAWPQGPVVREVWLTHHHRRVVRKISGGDPAALTSEEARAIDDVLAYYSRFDGEVLAEMSHREPWDKARGDLAPRAQSQAVISIESIREYFTGAAAEAEGAPRHRSEYREVPRYQQEQELRMQHARWKRTFDWLTKRDLGD